MQFLYVIQTRQNMETEVRRSIIKLYFHRTLGANFCFFTVANLQCFWHVEYQACWTTDALHLSVQNKLRAMHVKHYYKELHDTHFSNQANPRTSLIYVTLLFYLCLLKSFIKPVYPVSSENFFAEQNILEFV
jgi:hypothetical protein